MIKSLWIKSDVDYRSHSSVKMKNESVSDHVLLRICLEVNLSTNGMLSAPLQRDKLRNPGETRKARKAVRGTRNTTGEHLQNRNEQSIQTQSTIKEAALERTGRHNLLVVLFFTKMRGRTQMPGAFSQVDRPSIISPGKMAQL